MIIEIFNYKIHDHIKDNFEKAILEQESSYVRFIHSPIQ